MKRFIPLVLSSIVLSVVPAKATILYWGTDGTTTASPWQTSTNWFTDAAGTSVSGAAPSSADDVIFSTSGVTTGALTSFTAAASANSLTFNNSVPTTLRSSSSTGRIVTIGAGGITVNSTASTVTFGGTTSTINLTMGASQTWANHSASLMVVTNAVNGASGVPTTLTLSPTSSAGIQFNNLLRDGASGGALSLVVDATGTGGVTFLVSTNATFSGGTTIKTGVLNVRSDTNTLGTGNVKLGETAGTTDARLNLTTSSTFTGAGIVVQSGSGTRTISTNSGSTSTLATDVLLNGTLLARPGTSSGKLTFNGAISGVGSVELVQSNLELRGDNTYTGDTFLNAGSFQLTNVATNGVSTGKLTFQIQDGNISNKIYGDASNASASFDGTFKLDLSAVSGSSGLWRLVDTTTLNETFGSNFQVVDSSGFLTFTEAGNIWTSSNNAWTFTESNGQLSYLAVPEPGAGILLVAGLGFLFCATNRRSGCRASR